MSGPEGSCAHCGRPVGIGRFCTNCGAPVGSTPRRTREPVYDEPPYEPLGQAETGPRGLLAAWLWVAVAVVLMAVVLVAGWSLLRGPGGPGDGSGGPAAPVILPRSHGTHSAGRSPTASATSASASPSASASSSAPSRPVHVEGLARASAPSNAPAAVDFDGTPVNYGAPNMVDGSITTCWRAAGNATGIELTFRLAQPTRLTRVGLVNGYAKTAYSGSRRFDWYLGNRRVIAVDWVFDDGTTTPQLLSQTRQMQRVAVGPVTTRTVRLRITAVSPPGTGPAARDDTAISEVSLVGTPAD